MDENRKLARRLRKHDEKAFERIMDKFAPLVTTIIYNVSNGALSKEDIEETAMDVFVTLWRNAEKVGDNTLKGYLCCIAKTRAKNKLTARKQREIINIDDIDIEDDFSITGLTEKPDMVESLTEALNEIKETDREIIIRHYYYYQKVSEISEAMNLSEENIRVRLHRARNKLRKILTERGCQI